MFTVSARADSFRVSAKASVADEWDVIVVGAGPAGSSAAIAALQANEHTRVLLLDKEPPGRDKVCGDGIGPDVVDALDAIGARSVLRIEEAVSSFHVYVTDGPALTGAPPEPGYVIPRAQFDLRLLQLAQSSGVVFEQERCIGVNPEGDRVRVTTQSGKHLTARTAIAADGAYSPIRRSLGIEPNRGRHMAVAIRGYTTDPRPEESQLVIGWDCNTRGLAYVWKFPLADGRSNIGYGATLQHGPLSSTYLRERLQLLLPAGTSLDGVRLTGHQLPLSSKRPAPARDRVLLAGDAASLINPLSGEGIVYALVSGRLAGHAAACSTQPGATYTHALRQVLGRHHRHAALFSALATPAAVANAIRAARADERNLHALLGLALGTGTFTVADIARFARGSLTGLRAKELT